MLIGRKRVLQAREVLTIDAGGDLHGTRKGREGCLEVTSLARLGFSTRYLARHGVRFCRGSVLRRALVARPRDERNSLGFSPRDVLQERCRAFEREALQRNHVERVPFFAIMETSWESIRCGETKASGKTFRMALGRAPRVCVEIGVSRGRGDDIVQGNK